MNRAFLCILLVTACACSCAAGPNLLTNPSFDGDLDGDDFGWSVRRGGGPEAMNVAIDRDVTCDGMPSVRFTQQKPVYSSIGQTFEPKPRTIYAASISVRAEDFVTTSRGVRLFIGDENARTLTADRLWADEADGTWQRLTCVFTSGHRSKMFFIPMLNDVCGTVWFADPSLREVSPDEAAELTGRGHGWVWVEPPPETGVAFFGREAAHVHPGFPSITWLGNRNAFDHPGDAGMRMIVQLPEGVRLAGTYYGWSLAASQPVEGGTRYTLAGQRTGCPVYLTTDWEPGDTGTGRVWLEWADGRQEEAARFPIRCIDMPEGRRPERLICGLSGPRVNHYPGPMIDYVRTLGFNAVNLWTAAAWSAERDEELAAQVQDWREAGFRVSANYSPLNYRSYDEMLAEEEQAQACAIDGTRRATIPCPSYRGNAWQQEGVKIANLAEQGIAWAHLDEEVWNGHGICFCERCLGRWEDYRAAHYPDLEPLSPTQFEADPDDYPEHHAAWTRFKCSLVTEMFAGWRDMLRERAEATDLSEDVWLDSWLSVSPKLNRMYFNLHDPRTLPEGLDHLVPMLYETAAKVREHMTALVETAGAEKLLVGLTLGQPENGRDLFAPTQTRAQILEGVFAGARGYVFWTYPRSDAATLAAIARANATLARVEDVLLDGTRTNRLRGAEADVTAYEHDGRIVGLVRGSGSARLRVSGGGAWTVRDVADGNVLGRVSAPGEIAIEGAGREWPLVVELTRAQ